MGVLKKIWGGTKKVGSLLLRYAPLAASFGIGIQAIPEVGNAAMWVVSILRLFGVSPDPNFNPGVFGTELALFIGSARKLLSMLNRAVAAANVIKN
jgi:hypothetical protein